MKTMKKSLFPSVLCSIIALITFNSSTLYAQDPLTPVTITMSAGYANEIYYSMANGTVKVSPRNSWDIAFRTKKFSSSILTNDGSNVILFTYPKSDTTGWDNMDTTGFYSWTPMYNDPDNWENGAFSRNALEYPDYGWGKYNSVNHDIVGDSLFLILLQDGSLKKFWLQRKKSVEDIFIFKYANLDGSDEQQVSLDLNPFIDKDFYGFSFATNAGVDYQPLKADWDILFTKYMSLQTGGIPYPVVGVLNNDGALANSFHPVSHAYNDWWIKPWDSLRSPIGWSWKYYDFGANAWTVPDTTVYFIKTLQSVTYKMYFTAFEGTTTGLIRFNKGIAPGLGVENVSASSGNLSVWPNPATDRIHIDYRGSSSGSLVTLSDLEGRVIRRESLQSGQTSISINISGFASGSYLVTVSDPSGTSVKKLMITR